MFDVKTMKLALVAAASVALLSGNAQAAPIAYVVVGGSATHNPLPFNGSLPGFTATGLGNSGDPSISAVGNTT